jgi:hypothetical protein
MMPKAKELSPEEKAINAQKIKADIEEARLFYKNTLEQATDNGPSATSERASEIARMDEFGLLEFSELTGVGSVLHGIYKISEKGVRLRLDDPELNLTEQSRVSIRSMVERSALTFPCPPHDFWVWHEGTKASNGVSDFPLADGFLKALGKEVRVEIIDNVAPVPSKNIIEAFSVKDDAVENARWWSVRMRSAEKYAGLIDARALKGKGGRGNPSYWRPMVVAAWLIDKDHLTKKTVIHAVQTHFPECNVDYLGNI